MSERVRYPQQGERWRHVHTGKVVTITTVGRFGSTWFTYEDGTSGRALHGEFLPGRRQTYERVDR